MHVLNMNKRATKNVFVNICENVKKKKSIYCHVEIEKQTFPQTETTNIYFPIDFKCSCQIDLK